MFNRPSVCVQSLLLLLVTCALAGCAMPAVPRVGVHGPTAFAGRLWIVDDADTLLERLAPVFVTANIAPAAPEPPADPAALARWERPVSAWMDLELRAIADESLSPPRAARRLMLLSVAMNDTLSLGATTREAGMELSDDAALAEAAARLLIAGHPLLAPAINADAEVAAWAGYWRGDASPAAVANGRQLGAAVAEAVLTWAMADGSGELRPNIELPVAKPGVWVPTAPKFDLPQEPEWQRVATIAIGDPAALRLPPPPAWGSPAMDEQISGFVAAQSALTVEQRTAAARWAGAAGTVTPPGQWVEIARELIEREGISPAEAAGIYAALGVALHDGAVACWETKYHYWLARPIQVVQHEQPAWTPLLLTPPHPSYPSGHAVFSSAAAEVLAAAFPADAAGLAAQAEEAAASRISAGLHWPIDGVAGLEQGRQVAALVLARLVE